MAKIQSQSAFAHLDAARAAVVAVRLGDLMGLAAHRPGTPLDADRLARLAAAARQEGIAEAVGLGGALDPCRLLEALASSPLPAREIDRLAALLGYPRLAELAAVSEPSLRRYAAGERRVPDAVAGRVHFLAVVIAILCGSFNEFGIRRWFERPRRALGGRTPADALRARRVVARSTRPRDDSAAGDRAADMIAFRNTDIDVPFLWETSAQPPARWHGAGDGPAHYFSSTPEAAWAEFLRRQEIRDPADLAGIERVLWAVEFDDEEPAMHPTLPRTTVIGGGYRACQLEAVRLRAVGATRLVAPSAAVHAASTSGWRVEAGLRRGPRQSETTIVLFGPRPPLIGWRTCAPGAPGIDVLVRVRHRK